MNEAYSREAEFNRLAMLRERGAITADEYQLARFSVAAGASRQFRVEVERLAALWEQGAITDTEYEDRRRPCAMRLQAADAEKAEGLRRKGRLSDPTGRLRARAGIMLVCIATAAATWNLIMYNRDPYSNNPFIIPTMFIAFLLGPVALGMLISALDRMDRSSHPVPWRDRALAIVGIILAVVGAVETGYLILMGMASNLAV